MKHQILAKQAWYKHLPCHSGKSLTDNEHGGELSHHLLLGIQYFQISLIFLSSLYAQGGDKSIATLKLIQLHSRAPVSGNNTCIAECHRLCFCTCQVSLLLRKQAMARYCDTGVLLYGTSEHSKLYFCFQSLPKVTSLSKGSLYLGKEEEYFLS